MEEQRFLYKSPNHLANLNDIRIAGKLCDVIIKVDDKEIRAHKLILAAKLKYFESMFLSAFQESKQEVITMKDVERTNLEALISFAYTGEILLTDRNALGLLEVANYLGEDAVEEVCIEFLKKHLKEEDACRAYKFASAIDCLSLKAVAKEIILSYFKDRSQTTGILDLNFENLKDILSSASSDFSEAQNLCFESVMRWIVHDVKSRKRYTGDLLGLIDMSKLGTDYLLEYFCKSIGDQNYSDVTKDVMAFYCGKSQTNQDISEPQAIEPDEKIRQSLIIAGGIDKKLHFQFYDFVKKKWSDAHVEVAHSDSHIVGYVWNCGAIFDNKFYYNIENWRFRHLRVFDPTTKQSTRVASESRLLRHAAICSSTRYIYFCGGLNDDKSVSDRVLRYDPQADPPESFDKLTPMGTKRSSATAIFYRGRLYVLGGKDEKLQSLDVVEKYNPNTKKWVQLPSMSEPRSSIRVAALDGKLYACGGWPRSVFEAFDLSTKKWQMVAKMNHWRSDLLVVVYEGKLLAIGGNSKNTAEVYDPNKDQWQINHELSAELKIPFGTGGLIEANCVSS